MATVRSRWAAIGAAVAVTLGAGGISLGQAAIGSGDKPVFVAITPCRLVDTRPGADNIGSRSTPLGAGDTLTLQVTGSTGDCTGIPTDATAAAMNVTAIQGSTRSHLAVYPADADRPLASNLNWEGGDPPTPNKVDVQLSSSGAVKITNHAGTVHVAADLAGYYTDHHHDDRYYTKGEIDSAIAPPDWKVVLGAADLAPHLYDTDPSSGLGIEPGVEHSALNFEEGQALWANFSLALPEHHRAGSDLRVEYLWRAQLGSENEVGCEFWFTSGARAIRPGAAVMRLDTTWQTPSGDAFHQATGAQLQDGVVDRAVEIWDGASLQPGDVIMGEIGREGYLANDTCDGDLLIFGVIIGPA